MRLFYVIILFPLISFSQWNNSADFYHFGPDSNIEMGRTSSISANGNVVAFAAILNYENYEGMPKDAGFVDVFHQVNGVWTQKGSRIKGTLLNEKSGTSISLNADGSIIAIGSPEANSTTTNDGRVRIYMYVGNDWVLMGNIISGLQQYASMGYSLQLNNTGNTIAIGIPTGNVSNVYYGLVKVYEFNGTQWIQKGNTIVGNSADELFGISVAMNASGDRIVVGADDNDTGGSNKGKASVYSFNSGSWTQTGNALFGETVEGHFGRKVAINNSGNSIAISEPFWGSNSNQFGQTKIFELNSNTWVQKGNSIIGSAIGDLSGSSISFGLDGSQIAIGEVGFNDVGNNRGRVRVFKFQSNSWAINSSIVGAENNADFGASSKLSENADKIVIGAPRSSAFTTFSGFGVIYSQPTLSTDNFEANTPIKVYPNPTTHKIYIENDLNDVVEKIEILDIYGRKILSSNNTKESKISFDLEGFTNGIYIVEIKSDFKTETFKIIKK